MEENKDKIQEKSKYADVIARMKKAAARNQRQKKLDALNDDPTKWKNLT